MHFSTLLATVRVALLRSSWRSCFMRAALFIMRATNSSLVFTFSLWTSLFIHPHRQKSQGGRPTSNSCILTPIEDWTHVYMNLFTRNIPYYHLLKYLLFLLEHPVYTYIYECYYFWGLKTGEAQFGSLAQSYKISVAALSMPCIA